VAVAAGLASLDLIDRLDPYDALERVAAELDDQVSDALGRAGIPFTVNRVGSLFSVFFGPGPVTDFRSARGADHRAFARFFHAMLDRGVYLPPSGYEAWFLGTAHGPADVDRTVAGVREASRVVAG
jgi:glutamate-1-semialdehyde 2,1-aminomutase